ncbi:hypothetical protein [Hymenobacter rigui]|uniref:Nitroreductase domain-containing protein n=1 Tax=Hymenobacter rigui TaxID=334424 RepID=A0A3R9PVL8_9BACT|nr:hypothetical protein [Hymenobacter rigui]RSK46997.1 hypothetical protein EI291_16890 [Hymenobacter rigui]
MGVGAGLALMPRVGLGQQQPTAEKVWLELLEYARWCPSPHNTQPWKLQPLSVTQAAFYYDPTRLLPHTDTNSAFMTVALGMFLECLRVAAAPRGLALRVEHEPEPQLQFTGTVPRLFATLYLEPASAGAVATPGRELLRQRCTSRLPYSGRPVAAAHLQALTEQAAAQGHSFQHSSEPGFVEFVLDLNRQTLFSDLDDAGTRQEIARWIRTTDAEAQERQDGLWNRCMHFPGRLMRNFFTHHERFRAAWKRRILGQVYVHSMHGTSTVAWLQGPFGNRAEWLAAGTLLQQLWLHMTQQGLYLHPFGSVVTNPEAHARFLARARPESGQPLWLLLRLGYSAEPPRSLRLPASALLLPVA